MKPEALPNEMPPKQPSRCVDCITETERRVSARVSLVFGRLSPVQRASVEEEWEFVCQQRGWCFTTVDAGRSLKETPGWIRVRDGGGFSPPVVVAPCHGACATCVPASIERVRALTDLIHRRISDRELDALEAEWRCVSKALGWSLPEGQRRGRLSETQLAGTACVVCGERCRPMIPIEVAAPAAAQVFRCARPECDVSPDEIRRWIEGS
jgi:hypothetical protein